MIVLEGQGSRGHGKGKSSSKSVKYMANSPVVTGIKSPSDTTLYTPALKKNKQVSNAIERISDFVESMRLTDRRGRKRKRSQYRSRSRDSSHDDVPPPPQSRDRGRQPSSSERFRENDRDSRHEEHDEPPEVEDAILDAERFKASVVPPKGKLSYAEMVQLRKGDDDDDFFHISCHVSTDLREKIERGEFVDLDKLLPKEKCGGNYMYKEEKLMRLVQRGDETFYAPAQEMRVNSVRKWDQAFRIYAAIYTQANPERAGEVWQYIHVINVAALSYSWENVAYYDFTFRQLMAEKPWMSWAKTYTQAWHLALHETSVSNKVRNPRNETQAALPDELDWKDKCCWRYNKGKCKKNAASCGWDHRCSYCAGWYHGSSGL